MAGDHTVMQRAKSTTTFKSNVENISLQGGDVTGSVVGGGAGGCVVELNGRRPRERASSMPASIPPPSYGSVLSLVCRNLRPPRTPVATSPLPPEATSPRHGPEALKKSDRGKAGVAGPAVSTDVAVSVNRAASTGSAEPRTRPSTALRHHLGSTSFIFRRKREAYSKIALWNYIHLFKIFRRKANNPNINSKEGTCALSTIVNSY